ncbi:hypothetical protein NEUTE1DRAFT_96660 [Neurospora tetrasperma FGSC 2508]|uniref:Uncharacterized protein n=1 Tax=Neurospora tetrasperma (strain FGSC 2508 / ATCC MYA-4615 / P0657) TaxID=510951 RepID=F8N1L6_NEUT8|nr:uncharacterized protein NEUTE1DRAFT_96660 [Neurospora tetrasperma FGSC 2508]EGO52347.1 hypothetical protein NEUTE1DRAFT_96660 [Neurospora tetrasperma FGSC 2508]
MLVASLIVDLHPSRIMPRLICAGTDISLATYSLSGGNTIRRGNAMLGRSSYQGLLILSNVAEENLPWYLASAS